MRTTADHASNFLIHKFGSSAVVASQCPHELACRPSTCDECSSAPFLALAQKACAAADNYTRAIDLRHWRYTVAGSGPLLPVRFGFGAT